MENIKYGKLKYLSNADYQFSLKGHKYKMVKCICDCGNIKDVNYYHWKKGNVKSCGCLYKDISSKNNTKHNKYNTPEYISWKSMKARCTNPKATGYKNYGGFGITICKEWLESFEQFYKDMGKRPNGMTLDRINSFGNYEPSNCKWSSCSEQNNNKRKN